MAGEWDVVSTAPMALEEHPEFSKIIRIESGGKQFDKSGQPLKSSAGAIGISQVMPSTAPEAAESAGLSFDEEAFKSSPTYNKALGSAYFNKMVKEFDGDTTKAAAAYNAGPETIRKLIKAHGDQWADHLPAETKNYVRSFAGSTTDKGGWDVVDTSERDQWDVVNATPVVEDRTVPKAGFSAKKPKQETRPVSDWEKTVAGFLSGGSRKSFSDTGYDRLGARTRPAPKNVKEMLQQAKEETIGGLEATAGLAGETLFGIPALIPGVAPYAEKAMELTAPKTELGKQRLEDVNQLFADIGPLPELMMIPQQRLPRDIEGLGDLRRVDPGAEAWTTVKKERPRTYGEDLGPLNINKIKQYLSKEEFADPDVQEFIKLTDKVQKAEKISDPSSWTAQERAAYESGDWQEFSKLRGYTAAEIADYDNLLKVSQTLQDRYGSTNPDYTASLDHLVSQSYDIHPKFKQLESIQKQFKDPEQFKEFLARREDELNNLSFEEWHQMYGRQRQGMDPSLVSKEADFKDYNAFINRQAMEAMGGDPSFIRPEVQVPKIPEDYRTNQQWLADSLYSLGKGNEADISIAVNRLQSAEREGVTPYMKQRWREYAEGTLKDLTQPEMELFNKYYAPEAAERVRLLQYAQRKGYALPTELDPRIAGENVARIVRPKKGRQWERIIDSLTGRKGAGGFDVNIQKKPGAAMERSFFVAEAPSGKRIVIQARGDGTILGWQDGKARVFARDFEMNRYKAGEKLGSSTIKEARQNEIERHTPYEYEKDTQGVLYQRLAELKDFVRANDFITDLKNSPWMKEHAVKIEPGKDIPEGYKRPNYLDRVPQFDGYAFREDVANIIEDFARVYEPNFLTGMSGALIKNMMLNPLPHMANEAWHLYNARGLTGWVTPAGIYRFAKTGMPALKSVITQDAAFRETLREGGSILSSRVRNTAFMEDLFQKANKEFSKTTEFEELAQATGMKPIDLYNAISKKSNIAMWTLRDAMYMQLVNEEMMYNGLTRKQAIQEVERHMPSYRIPTKVMGSRMASQVLQDPRVTVFSRYHYGLVNSLKETAKDLAALKQGRAGVRHFLKGADTAAAIAVAVAALYPLQDMIAQALSGNEDAIQRRAGPYHIFHALYDIAQHEKDPMAFLAGIFTFNPALLWGAQLIANRKLYNGQPVYNPDNINEFTGIDGVGKVAEDIAKYTLSTLPQAGQFIQAQKYEDEGFQEWLMRQLDIVSPPSEKVMKQEKQQQKRVKGGTRQVMKWESDLD